MLRKIDYTLVLTNLGATEDEINELLAEEREEVEVSAYPDCGDRECESCGTTVLAVPHCSACGAHSELCPF